MATGAKTCKCGAKLRSDNTTGMCQRCYPLWWAKQNRDLVNKQNRAHYSPAKERARYLADPEPDKARARAWRAANGRSSNPEAERADSAARHALKQQLFVERVFRSVVWSRDKGICHLCLQPANESEWHLDHVISLFDGGPHCYANTAVSHPICNTSKGRNSRSSCGVRWAEATGAYKQFHDKEYM